MKVRRGEMFMVYYGVVGKNCSSAMPIKYYNWFSFAFFQIIPNINYHFISPHSMHNQTSPIPYSHPKAQSSTSTPSSTSQSHPLLSSSPTPPFLHDSYPLYLDFKQKLLTSMQEMDPLTILQSGIFQEYQQNMWKDKESIGREFKEKVKITEFQTQEGGFESKMSMYEVSDDVEVLQLEQRSRSCQRLSRQQRAVRRAQMQRNTQFVLFASALKTLTHNHHIYPSQPCQSQPQPNQNQPLQFSQKPTSIFQNDLQKQLLNLKCQNQHLKVQLQACTAKLQYQRTLNKSHTNASHNKQLQFLLKEKQLNKKLQQIKTEADQLRTILQNQNSELANSIAIKENGVKQGPGEGRLASLKEKVAVQGRIRWALGKAWGAELEANCQ